MTNGATGELRADVPTELTIGDSMILVSGLDLREATRSVFYVYFEDIDATSSRAMIAGAISLEEPKDVPSGDRRAMVEDPFGNAWQIATMTVQR